MEGIIAALVVPFHENGKIDEQGLRNIVRFNIDVNHIDGFYVNGSTGENFLISTDEKKQILEIVKDEAKNDVHLIAQIGSINLYEAVELGQFATELGYSCLSAVTPFYYNFSFEEIRDYYMTIVNETQNNMLIYSMPSFTGVDMSLKHFGDLLKNNKVIGVKYTNSDFFLLERLRKMFPEKLIFSGFDEMLLSASVLGVNGAIGSTFNINAKRAKEIFQFAKSGQIEEARKIQHETNDLIEKILQLGIYQTIKEILAVKGVITVSSCRKPFKGFDQRKREQVAEMVKEFNL